MDYGCFYFVCCTDCAFKAQFKGTCVQIFFVSSCFLKENIYIFFFYILSQLIKQIVVFGMCHVYVVTIIHFFANNYKATSNNRFYVIHLSPHLIHMRVKITYLMLLVVKYLKLQINIQNIETSMLMLLLFCDNC